jgi:hypothetical protein
MKMVGSDSSEEVFEALEEARRQFADHDFAVTAV